MTSEAQLAKRIAASADAAMSRSCAKNSCQGAISSFASSEPPAGHDPARALVGVSCAGAPRFATFRVKHDAPYRRKWGVRYRRARLPADVLREIDEASRRISRR